MGIKMNKFLAISCMAVAAMAAPEAEADPYLLYGGYGGYGLAGYYGGYPYGLGYAHAAVAPVAAGYASVSPSASVSIAGLAGAAVPAVAGGYAAAGRYVANSAGVVHVAKREAEADAEADPYYAYGYHGLGYAGYAGYHGLGYAGYAGYPYAYNYGLGYGHYAHAVAAPAVVAPAVAEVKAGVFADEITPITLKIKKKEVEMKLDEHPKPKTTLEQLAKLPPVFKKGGVVTAGGASGICDGAAAVMIASEEAVKEHNLTPLARIVGYGVAGCEPTIMGIGPVPSIQAMLEKTGVSLGEVDQIEINEAFAAQALSCQKALDIPMEKFNTCGGAVALGHPLAASGSRISAHLVHKLRRNGEKYGIGSACIGGGQGIAILFERV